MPRGFGRLPFLGRLSTRGERSPSDDVAPIRAPLDPDLAPIGPPVLLPSAIIRQVLFEPTEMVPVWARPRTEPVLATPVAAPRTEPTATKRPRRPKAAATPAAKPAGTAKPRSRTRKREA